MEKYLIGGLEDFLTPALALYADCVEANIAATISLLNGDAARWRPHIKTIKLQRVIEILTASGVRALKCATTLELITACKAGAEDVLFAMAANGANGRRVADIAQQFPEVAVSVLIDDELEIEQWAGTPVGVFIDVNPGMDRTGISQDNPERILSLAQAIQSRGLEFRGLHFYDGHRSEPDLAVRTAQVHAGYDHLLEVIEMLEDAGVAVEEVITCGTPAFACALSYHGFRNRNFLHRLSPGTLIYGDLTSRQQLPSSLGYQLGAVVVSRVISHPRENIITCDAGHKVISIDMGVPNCEVLGRKGLVPMKPSEEHLPVAVEPGVTPPAIGEILYLVPKHVCPTVNNFSHALFIRDGVVLNVDDVTARGRETPEWRNAV